MIHHITHAYYPYKFTNIPLYRILLPDKSQAEVFDTAKNRKTVVNAVYKYAYTWM